MPSNLMNQYEPTSELSGKYEETANAKRQRIEFSSSACDNQYSFLSPHQINDSHALVEDDSTQRHVESSQNHSYADYYAPQMDSHRTMPPDTHAGSIPVNTLSGLDFASSTPQFQSTNCVTALPPHFENDPHSSSNQIPPAMCPEMMPHYLQGATQLNCGHPVHSQQSQQQSATQHTMHHGMTAPLDYIENGLQNSLQSSASAAVAAAAAAALLNRNTAPTGQTNSGYARENLNAMTHSDARLLSNTSVNHEQAKNLQTGDMSKMGNLDLSSFSTENCLDTTATTKKLLNVLGKEPLINIVVELVNTQYDLMNLLDSRLEQCAQCRRLMVRNINFVTEPTDLRDVFLQFGEIEDFTIVRDNDTKKSKGFGFVTFRKIAAVRAALQSDVVLHGRPLQIKLAATSTSEPFKRDGSGASPNRGKSGSRNYRDESSSRYPRSRSQHRHEPERRKLFLRNLNPMTTSDTIRMVFEEFGEIDECTTVIDHATGKGKGYGFVTYMSPSSASKAIKASQRVIDNQIVFVSYASSDKHNPKKNSHSSNSYRNSGHSSSNLRSHMDYSKHSIASNTFSDAPESFSNMHSVQNSFYAPQNSNPLAAHSYDFSAQQYH